MNTTTRTSTAETPGRTFGRGWRALRAGERRASNWLVSKACRRLEPPRSCGWLSWLRSGLLYTHLLAGPVMVCVMVVAWMALQHRLGRGVASQSGAKPDQQDSACDTYDGFRIDPHVGTTSSDHFFGRLINAFRPFPPASPLASPPPLLRGRYPNTLPARTPAQAKAMIQNVGSTMNIVPVTNIRSMSPKALFSPPAGRSWCAADSSQPPAISASGSSNRSSAQAETKVREEGATGRRWW